MSEAPKTIGLMCGPFGWRLWNRYEDDEADARYVLETEAAATIASLTAERDRLREALEEIATGRNKDGLKVDFFQDIASAALKETGE